MSLNERIELGIQHREQHSRDQRIINQDQTCSRCYPPTEITDDFERFWDYYSQYLVHPAIDYSEITVQRYTQAHLLLENIRQKGFITSATQTVLQAIQRVVHTIHYRVKLRVTSTQIAIRIVVSYLLTQNFRNTLSLRQSQAIVEFTNPVLNDNHFYIAIQQILTAYQNTQRELRSSDGVAPQIEPHQPQDISRPVTPIVDIDSSEPTSPISETRSE